MQNETQKIAVLGAGQMGAGIAQVAAAVAGWQVVLYDLERSVLDKAVGTIGKSLEKLSSKGKLDCPVNEALANISTTTTLEDVRGSELMIEAIVEDQAIKSELFARLAKLADEQTVLASNTSSIPIAELGRASGRPQQVVGMHFMNPVPLMALVEVIHGPLTDEACAARTMNYVEVLGKTAVVSKDYPGFVVNRILMPMINEAFFALQEGLAKAEDIDTAMKLGTNQPMGPLSLADFIGLDTCLAILDVLYEGFGDPKYRASALLRQYVAAGLTGRKSGQGVFQYGS